MWRNLQTYAAEVAALLLTSACTGQRADAQTNPTARFVGISDAVPSNYFDARASAPDPADPNSLLIGFDSGSDPTTLIARDFRASVEIAWAWLRFQPNSKLSQWYEQRFAKAGKRMRRIGIVALARRLVIDLWRYVESGILPEGAQLKASANSSAR